MTKWANYLELIWDNSSLKKETDDNKKSRPKIKFFTTQTLGAGSEQEGFLERKDEGKQHLPLASLPCWKVMDEEAVNQLTRNVIGTDFWMTESVYRIKELDQRN
jgi:hypothetical protein